MSNTIRNTVRNIGVVTAALALTMVGALSALAADDITTGPPTDGTTDGTSVSVPEPSGEVSVEGEIRTSSISFTRTVAETSIVYYFVYSGPGSIDFSYDDPDGCLVSFTAVVDAAMKHCAI